MGNVNIFHDALSFNTKEGGSNGGLSIHAKGAGGGDGLQVGFIQRATVTIDSSGSLPVLKIPGVEHKPTYIVAIAGAIKNKVTLIASVYDTVYDLSTDSLVSSVKLSRMYCTGTGGIRELTRIEGCGDYDPNTKTWSVSGTNTYPFSDYQWDVLYFYE